MFPLRLPFVSSSILVVVVLVVIAQQVSLVSSFRLSTTQTKTSSSSWSSSWSLHLQQKQHKVRLYLQPTTSDRDADDEDDDDRIATTWKVSPPPPKTAVAAATASSSISSTTSASSSIPYPSRRIRIERYARLPVWPVWMGVLLFMVGLVNKQWASRIENWSGGRVCPIILQQDEKESQHSTCSPFLLLVHHNHLFAKWDFLFRSLSKQFLPEGFPSHPHRGFTTLTYIMQGGFIHRDSVGVKQSYSAQKNSNNDDTGIIQWLFTGCGLLHEEMFDLSSAGNRHELYQIWINVPSRCKLQNPTIEILSNKDGEEDIPIIKSTTDSRGGRDGGDGNTNDDDDDESSQRQQQQQQMISTKSIVRVLAGNYYDSVQHQSYKSGAPTMSDMNVLHTTISTIRNRRLERRQSQKQQQEDTGSTTTTTSTHPGWTYEIPSNYDTLLLYIRKGSCKITTTAISRTSDGRLVSTSQTQHASIHSTVFVEHAIEQYNTQLVKEILTIQPQNVGESVDILLLGGQPLYEEYSTSSGSTSRTSSTTLEPVSMQGSMVMNYPHEIQQAYLDYQKGKMGLPWDHQLTDQQWKQHITKFPSQYKYDTTKKKNGKTTKNKNDSNDDSINDDSDDDNTNDKKYMNSWYYQ